MAFEARPIQPRFAGEVVGVDLRRPMGEDDIAAVHAAMDRYAVLVFHGQKMNPDEHLAFTRRLGPIQPNVNLNLVKVQDRRIDTNFSDVSNIGKDDRILPRDSRRRLFSLGNRLWHSDASYRPVPAMYSLLYAYEVPPVGGETEFADMRQAYDTLDAETKAEIEELICEHSNMFSRALLGFDGYSDEEEAMFKPVLQRLVRHHPEMGNKKTLYMSSHIGGIIGWPRPEAMAFVRDLMEHATQREFVYSHKWQSGDLVIWDNRQTMHRARRFDDQKYRRDVRRTTTMCDRPTVEQQAA